MNLKPLIDGIARQTTMLLPLVSFGCGDAGPSADELNESLAHNMPSGSGSNPGSSDSSSPPAAPVVPAMSSPTTPPSTPGSQMPPRPLPNGAGSSAGGSGPAEPTGTAAAAGPSGSGGTTPSAPAAGGTSAVPDESGGSPMAEGGAGGTLTPAGGASPVEGSAGALPGTAGAGPVVPVGPYDARSGSFKMLVYSKTAVFRHDAAITTGKTMLQQIATEQGFEVTFTEDNALINLEGLSQFEIVFFLNTTGDIFNEAEQQAYQQWMSEYNGAFAGVHSATDTENGWDFYSEVTGQYYDGHSNINTPDQIQFESSMLSFPALAGLPNPWQRNEEWYKFDHFQSWSAKPGFTILGRKAADAQPIIWIRQWGNFRAFYTAIGHDGSVFDNDNDVKRHLTGGIMWAVRREALIQ